MDAAERALLDGTVRGVLERASTAGCAVVDRVLSELGWLDMLGTERDDAIDVVFTALGATGATASALDDVVVSALGLQPRAELAGLLPRFDTWNPPGSADGDAVSAEGLASGRAPDATEVLVVCGDSATAIPRSAVDASPIRGVDPDAGMHSVRIGGAAGTATQLAPGAWEAAVALGRRAVAHQMCGASRTMLELARAHALERVQFGRPIARFQAVRHRLADALVAIEALEAALAAARDESSATTAALGKALAGRTARTVGAHCQQVLAGIGFTTEHPFHRFLKRTILLEGILGTADRIEVALGRQLLATRTVPHLIEL
jgi:hypothetical protein